MELSNEEKFMTVELVERITAEFNWPEIYIIEDDLPDGIIVRFPKCDFYLIEAPNGEVILEFLEDTDFGSLNLIDALTIIVPGYCSVPNIFSHLELRNDTSIYSSLQKVENEIRDICILANEYLKPYIKGNKDWVTKFRDTHPL